MVYGTYGKVRADAHLALLTDLEHLLILLVLLLIVAAF